MSFWNPAFICGKPLVFSSLRRAVALCVPCFSKLLRFLKLLFLTFFHQSSFLGLFKNCRLVFFENLQKNIFDFFFKKKNSLLFFFLWSVFLVSLFFMQDFQQTFRYFLCFQHHFEKISCFFCLDPFVSVQKKFSPQNCSHSLYFFFLICPLFLCPLLMSALLVVTIIIPFFLMHFRCCSLHVSSPCVYLTLSYVSSVCVYLIFSRNLFFWISFIFHFLFDLLFGLFHSFSYVFFNLVLSNKINSTSFLTQKHMFNPAPRIYFLNFCHLTSEMKRSSFIMFRIFFFFEIPLSKKKKTDFFDLLRKYLFLFCCFE